MRRTYIIEVCLSCGRHAVWPFCEHRPQHYDPMSAVWCAPIVVEITKGSETFLAKYLDQESDASKAARFLLGEGQEPPQGNDGSS